MTVHPISVAPMMKCTDRHDRNFLRTISKKVLLYTEMLTTQAIVHARDPSKLLSFEESEHPLALQIAGSDPVQIRDAVLIANSYKFDEINFNLGCPSKRVQKNNFGACLMSDYQLVLKCLKSIVDTSKVPISIKMRTGINNCTSYEFLKNFVNHISDSGCTKYIIHARNALLGSLSPKNNLKIPPLKYDYVYRLKNNFPFFQIILNGGIRSLMEVDTHLNKVDGIMMGRGVYNNPYLLTEVDKKYYNVNCSRLDRFEIIDRYLPYVEKELEKGVNLHQISRHMLGLFKGINGSKVWKKYLSENILKDNTGINILKDAKSNLLNI